jgi:ABC-type transport system substrate-binding protein
VKARQAVFFAIDPWRHVDEVWHGGATPTPGLPVPSASWLPSKEELQEFLGQPERAAALLAEAGVAPGTQIEMTVGEFAPAYVDHALRIAADLGRIGLRPSLQRVSTRRFGDDVWFGGRYQMFVGAQPPVASLSDYLFAVHHSRGAWNTAGYGSPELDALIERQSIESDPAKRRDLVLAVQREILAGAYRVSPATLYTHWAWWPGVQGFVPNTYRGESFFLARTWLTSQ